MASTPKLHRSEFLRRLVAAFPALREAMRGEHTGLHTEMSVFREFTQQAIDAGDAPLVARCFAFASESLSYANSALRNALAVSYLEDLNFGGPKRAFAERLLPEPLNALRASVLGYLFAITGKQRWPAEAEASSTRRRRPPKSAG